MIVGLNMAVILATTGPSPSSLGVLTARPETLTNDFFVNLLEMDTEWHPTSGAGETFEGRSRRTGEVKCTGSRVGLIVGSNSDGSTRRCDEMSQDEGVGLTLQSDRVVGCADPQPGGAYTCPWCATGRDVCSPWRVACAYDGLNICWVYNFAAGNWRRDLPGTLRGWLDGTTKGRESKAPRGPLVLDHHQRRERPDCHESLWGPAAGSP